MKKKVLILGAGYGGLMTAIKFEAKTKGRDDVDIVLVDKNSYHQYVHLAYEIVTGVKKISDLTIPMTDLLKDRNIHFVQATINTIDLQHKTVKTDHGDLQYDELVIALGNEPNFYHIKGAKENSLVFNSVETAAKIRDEIKKEFRTTQKPNIVIGGGGFTGVELAGEILDEYKCCVTIIEGNDNLLISWKQPEFSEKVKSVLEQMGAKLLLGKLIVEVKPDQVVLKDGEQVSSSIFIWTAGVEASSLVKNSGLKTEKGNRASINKFCEAEGYSGIYVIGDSALVTDSETGEHLPQCIEIALQQAETVSDNLLADLRGAEKTVFHPNFHGLILAVGEAYGLGRLYGVTVEGKVAQWLKHLVHLQYVYEIAGLREAIKENF